MRSRGSIPALPAVRARVGRALPAAALPPWTLLAVAAAAAIALADGWRGCVLALLAAGAVILTQARYAGRAALALLLAVALASVAGAGPGGDVREPGLVQERPR